MYYNIYIYIYIIRYGLYYISFIILFSLLDYVMLYHIILFAHDVILYYIILHYIILHYFILHYIIWCYFFIILYDVILYYIISFGLKLYCHLFHFWSLDTVLALDTRKCVLMAPCVSPSYSSIFLVDSTSIKSSRMNTWKTWKWNLTTNNSECSLGSVNFLQPIHLGSFSRSSRI